MANARFSTNGTTWSTVTVNQTSDAKYSTSFISSALSSGKINNFAYVDGIWAASTDNGVLLKSSIEINNHGNFDTVYHAEGVTWITGISPSVIQQRVHPFQGANFSGGIAYANGVWIICGDTGKIQTSTNLVTWITRTSNATTSFNSIVYGNIWLANLQTPVGLMRSSTDGITWVTQNNGSTTGQIFSIAYGNGLWVAGGGSANLRTSTNGVSWIGRTSNFGASTIRKVAYGNVWLAVGDGGQIRSSTDAVTWTTRTSNFGATGILNLAYGNGRWVVVGNAAMRSSTDGITWVTRTHFGSANNQIAYANGLWIVNGAGAGVMGTSTDTITWVTRNTPTAGSLLGIAYANGIWVIPMLSQWIATSSSQNTTLFSSISKIINLNDTTFGIVSSGQLYTSTNLETFTQTTISWTTQSLNNILLSNGIYIYCFNGGQLQIDNAGSVSQITTGINDNFLSAAQKSGIYNVVGQNAIYRSTNLVNWTTISTPSNAQGFDTTNTGVTWTTRNAFFGTTAARGLGFGGPVTGSSTGWLAGGYSGQLRESTNGISWATVTFNFGTTRITSIAYGNVWLIGGYAGQIRSSTNGITWVTRNANFTSSQAISNILYANSQWLVVGGAGQVQHSTDAISWTTRNAQTTNEFNTVGYGNGVWLVAGLSGTVRSSTDTISWTTITTGYTPTYRAIAYANGIWILTGNTSGIPGALQPVRSTDLITWTTVSMGWNNSSFSYDPGPRQIAYANGLWVAGGQPDGAIYTSTDSISWVSRTNFSSYRGTTINNIAYGNGIWVGIGGYSALPLSLTVTSPQIVGSRPITDIIAI